MLKNWYAVLWTSSAVNRRVITSHISTLCTIFPWADTEMELSVALQFLAQKCSSRFPSTNHSSFPVLNLMPQQHKVLYSCSYSNQTYTMFTDKSLIFQTIFNSYQDLWWSGFNGTPMLGHSSSGFYKENEDGHGLRSLHIYKSIGAGGFTPDYWGIWQKKCQSRWGKLHREAENLPSPRIQVLAAICEWSWCSKGKPCLLQAPCARDPPCLCFAARAGQWRQFRKQRKFKFLQPITSWH